MTDKALDTLATLACCPETSVSELRRVALVAIGELSMLRKEYALLREAEIFAPAFADREDLKSPMADPALACGVIVE